MRLEEIRKKKEGVMVVRLMAGLDGPLYAILDDRLAIESADV